MKALKIEHTTGETSVIDLYDNENRKHRLEQFYHHLECDIIDMVTVWLDNKKYVFVVDDNGLLKQDPVITIFRNGEPWLVGNVIITKPTPDGDLESLQPDDYEILEKALHPKHYAKFDELEKPKRGYDIEL